MGCNKITKSVSLAILLAILVSFCYFFDFSITDKRFYSSVEAKGNIVKVSSIVESPILIDAQASGIGAHNWTWASSQPWCNGSGTKEEPYCISYLKIDGNGVSNCVEIRNSLTTFFIIKDCILYNAGDNETGNTAANIMLINSRNGKILSNDIANYSLQVTGITVKSKAGGGIVSDNCSSIEIVGNSIFNNRLNGIGVFGSHKINVSSNIITNHVFSGIEVREDCEFVNIVQNQLIDDSDAIAFQNMSHIIILRNSIIGSRSTGIIGIDAQDARIESNTIRDCTFGIEYENVNSTVVISNQIKDNGYGIRFWWSDSNSVTENSIVDNSNCPLYLLSSNYNSFSRNIITGNVESLTQIGCVGNRFENNIIFNRPDLYFVITVVVLVGIAGAIGRGIYRKRKKRKLE